MRSDLESISAQVARDLDRVYAQARFSGMRPFCFACRNWEDACSCARTPPLPRRPGGVS